MRSAWVTFLVFSAMVVGTDAQTGRRPASPTFKTEAVALVCPSPLGQGVATQREFCSIQADIEPSAGAIVRLPPHRGPATLSFDLHNRHMYSAELVDRGRGYTRATATIGVLAMEQDASDPRCRADRVPRGRRSVSTVSPPAPAWRG
jgi:hypothetical protein